MPPARGRPPVFTGEALRNAGRYSYARSVRSRRGTQDLVYRMFAVATLEHYCEAFPESAEALSWLLRPTRRHTLLTELGRLGRPRSAPDGTLEWDEAGVTSLVAAALMLAERRPRTKDGVAMLRARRLSTTA